MPADELTNGFRRDFEGLSRSSESGLSVLKSELGSGPAYSHHDVNEKEGVDCESIKASLDRAQLTATTM